VGSASVAAPLAFGLSCNVRDTYRFLVHNFEPGDELFFFGFQPRRVQLRAAPQASSETAASCGASEEPSHR